VEVAAGSYIVRFSAAQRANVQASSQTFAVEVDGAVVGTFTPAGTGYAAYATAGFTLTAGAHTITFVGLDPDGLDNTAFLDQVQLVQTPALTALSASASSLAEGRSISLSGSFTDDPAHDQATTAVVTGKPIELGGSRGRREATGRGVMICVDKAIAKLGMKKETTRVVVQGFGNVGSLAAELMQKAGYKIVGLADIGGGLYNEKGFHVPKVIEWVYTQKKSLQDFPGGGTKMSSRDVLFQPCDVLIPAAIENQITEQNAHQVQCKILCEGANGPTTWQADAIIDAKGVFTVPDILGNAGGVTVSYFEWVQDRQGFFWRESEVNERLLDVMERSFDEVVRYAETHKVNNRIAAYMLAIDRVATALKLRGIYA